MSARVLMKIAKGVFVGSGSEGMGNPQVVDAVLSLCSSPQPNVLYIGTATYDLPGPMLKQTSGFRAKDCHVSELKVAAVGSFGGSHDDLKNVVDNADVIIVSGGNTLFAIDRWHNIGLDALLRSACERGAVLSGGSAGAICWFDAGHSDSADPETFCEPMLAAAASANAAKDESSAAPEEGQVAKDWSYLRAPCLGFLPGLVCPHYDKTQSNGVLRAIDFDAMLTRHPGENGICIDHFAALVVDAGRFSILSMRDKPGSVTAAGSFAPGEGRPGVWRKWVDRSSGTLQSQLVPSAGQIEDILGVATEVVPDPQVEVCRTRNPAPKQL